MKDNRLKHNVYGTALIIAAILIIFTSGRYILPCFASSLNTSPQSESERAMAISDLMRFAFSDAIWNEDAYSPDGNGFSDIIQSYLDGQSSLETIHNLSKSLSKHHPWFAPYFDTNSSYPKRSVINKWSGPITIGYGWPRYNPTIPRPLSLQEDAKTSAEGGRLYPLVEATVQEIIPTIMEITGSKVTFLDHADTRETSKHHARIRIIPLKKWPPRTAADSLVSGWTPYEQEKYLWGAVLLQTSYPEEMDAYFIPNDGNNLSFAVCKIKADLPSPVFAGRVKECVVRALGLPGHGDPDIFPHQIEPIGPREQALTRLLYCKDIKPGTSKFDVFETLVFKNRCN